jgi:IS30 family transposase
MPRSYVHLTIRERAVLMTMRDDQCSIRSIARRLCRSPSSISRELRRAPRSGAYDAKLAHLQSAARRVAPGRRPRLHVDDALLQVVRHYLSERWSLQQIANILRAMWPDESDKTVSRETIYNAIYLHPRGELKRELIACLRHRSQIRKPRSRGVDRRGQIEDMQSIHIRPPEIEDGTLVERTTRFVVLATMDNAGTRSVVDSFSAVLNRQPAAQRKPMTYDLWPSARNARPQNPDRTQRRADLLCRPAQPLAARLR